MPRPHDVVEAKHDVVEAKHDVIEAKHDVIEAKHDVIKAKHDVIEAKHDVICLLQFAKSFFCESLPFRRSRRGRGAPDTRLKFMRGPADVARIRA